MNLAVQGNTLPAPTSDALAKIQRAEEFILSFPQIGIQTEHVIHAGMYARTIRLAGGVICTGSLMKVPTMFIVSGKCKVFTGDGWIELEGYQVIAASKGRKQIVITYEETAFTMIFKTDAKTVEEAEAEFTDCADRLMSRKSDNDIVIITGE